MKTQKYFVRSGLVFFLALAAIAIPQTRARAMTDVPCDNSALVNAIQNAVDAGGAQELSLAENCTYTLTTVNNGASTIMANGLPIIANNVELNIVGNNATIQRDANAPQFRILQIASGSALTISAITVRGGRAADGVESSYGGPGGGIYNSGTLDISDCNILENRSGAGSKGQKGGGGGGIFNEGTLTVTRCNISRNTSGAGSDFKTGGNGGDGGGVYNKGTVTIQQSAIYNNTTGKGGDGSTGNGGRAGHGGGIMLYAGTVTLANSTVSGNKTGRGGNSSQREGGQGGWGGGIAVGGGKVTITNSTIAKNKPGKGGSGFGPVLDGKAGGIWNMNRGKIDIANTILANNAPGENCSGVMKNVANNLDTGASCGFGSVNGSQSNANPNLGPLADNGGATLTHALKKPSAALNKGKPAVCASAPINNLDQRGIARPQGKRCDIGAFELQAGD